MSKRPEYEKMIVAFTDGACKGNPGPGGWGAIVATPEGQVKELGGGGKDFSCHLKSIKGDGGWCRNREG